MKEADEDRKRLVVENRRLAKDKSFYETEYKALLEEDETSTLRMPPKNGSNSAPTSNSTYRTRHSSPMGKQLINYSTGKIKFARHHQSQIKPRS